MSEPQPKPTPPKNTFVKGLLGCLIVILVLSLVGGVAIWWFVIRPLGNTLAGFASLAKLQELDNKIQNKTPFGPVDRPLSQEELDQFLSVQRAMQKPLKDVLATLEEKSKEANLNNTSTAKDWEIFTTQLGNVFSSLSAAKTAQVDAINRLDLSKSKYIWMRNEIYRAVWSLELGNANAFQGFPQYQSESPLGSVSPETRMANEQLVQPYKKELWENVALHSFGL